MGPTNIALVKLFEADQQLRQAQERLESATRNVRLQERRLNDLNERLKLGQSKVKEQQARAGALELELKTRDARIERLRTQQQTAKNNKEYQTFLVEINTEKVDRSKVEDELLKVMEALDAEQKQAKDLSALAEAEQQKLATMQGEIGGRVQQLQAEVEAIRPKRQAAAEAVSPQALQAFERLASRFEGEALASIGKPYPKREEYICNACNMSLVVDVYNRLHTRDEVVFCPSCRRMLFIPADLPVDEAVQKPKERKERKGRGAGKGRIGDLAASVNRQTSAADVLRSMQPEEESPEQEPSLGQEASPGQEAAPEQPALQSQQESQPQESAGQPRQS